MQTIFKLLLRVFAVFYFGKNFENQLPINYNLSEVLKVFKNSLLMKPLKTRGPDGPGALT